MSCRRYLVCGLLLALVMPSSIKVADAQSAAGSYPNRPVRLVVGFAPGGGNDIIARLLADKLGQPVIVENKPGAEGAVAAAFVRAQPADRYTLVVRASGAMVIGAAVGTPVEYDTLADFEPISILGTFPLVLSVNADARLESGNRRNGAADQATSDSTLRTLQSWRR